MKKVYTEAGLDQLIRERGFYDNRVVRYAQKLEAQEMLKKGLTIDEYYATIEIEEGKV